MQAKLAKSSQYRVKLVKCLAGEMQERRIYSKRNIFIILHQAQIHNPDHITWHKTAGE